MEELSANASSYMFVYFLFLLALNFVFRKTKMFILFAIKQLLDSLLSDIEIYSAKLSITRLGKLIGGNLDRNITYLNLRTNFCVYLSYFAKYLFLRMVSF